MKRLSFKGVFGVSPQVHAEAPGRVNLMGEHTDYNGGYVLPTALLLHTRVDLATRSDDVVRISSVNVEGPPWLTYVLGRETPVRSWIDYVQGVTAALRTSGVAHGGFDALIDSSVPLGAGLSSSAALEVSLLRALREAFGLILGDLAIARCGRAAETDFVGAPVGIMDQMAATFGRNGEALFLDTRSMAFERIALPEDAELVVIDSGLTHDHATGDYGTRRAECTRAAQLLGVSELRDVDETCIADIDELPEPLSRRVRHVVTENARVARAAAGLQARDWPALGQIFAASQASMRDDFEVSVPEIDRLVEIAVADPDVFCARLTGGGFGGSIVALARRGSDAPSRVAGKAGRGSRVLVPGVPS